MNTGFMNNVEAIQAIFLQLLFAHVEVFQDYERTQTHLDPKLWFHFSTSPKGQLLIVDKFLDLIKTLQTPDFSKLSTKTPLILVLDEMCSVLTWNVEHLNSSDFLHCIRAVSCPQSFRCSFLVDTNSEVLEHPTSATGKSCFSGNSTVRILLRFLFTAMMRSCWYLLVSLRILLTVVLSTVTLKVFERHKTS
ncbi:hypothetical protein GEMRC1_009844 [Eukaryota sp. GEM-RC1]